MDMPEIIDNVFMRATEFMHQSGIRMDEDHVGKQQDLYLWCSVGGAKNLGLWGCLMRFTTGCPCAIRITEARNYLTLSFPYFGLPFSPKIDWTQLHSCPWRA